MSPSIHKNQGMAMLMALVILAIASSLAVGMWYQNQLSLSRISNLQKSYQAKHYSQGMLLWASDILREDYEQDEFQHDSSTDPWQQGIQGMVVEDAVLSGTLVGLNGRFNVNNLVINGRVSEPHVAYFRRLLLILQIDINLADKVIDWIDVDQEPEANGAEDFQYLAKSPGYQTSGGHFKHVEQLRLLAGISTDEYNRLSPHISTLPVKNSATRINVNTSSAVLLRALHSEITDEMAVLLYDDGQANHLRVADFFEANPIKFKLFGLTDQIEPLISTQSLYLQAASLVQMDDNIFTQYALLERMPAGNALVISRSMSPYLPNALLK